MRKSTKNIFLALLPFFTSCVSSNDAMDTDGALDIVASYVARIDTTQYKIDELDWHDDNGDNSLRMATIEMIGRNDSCDEYTVFRDYGLPKPEIKPASPRTIPRFTFDKARGIARATRRMEYRTMRGIMREAKELEVKVDEVK